MYSISEALRKIYVDLIKRRSLVRVMPAQEASTLSYSPIFLVGIYRSGTTLVRYVIDSHSQICCPPETDFIVPLSKLTEDVYLSGFKGMGFDEAHVIGRVRDFLIYFYENYARTHQKKRWADKSPSYVDCLDFIAEAFPEAQFIMIYRHPLDQVHSFTRGGTFIHEAIENYLEGDQDIRVGATHYWVEKADQMLLFEKQFPDRCFHLHYEKLCEFPDDVIKSLFEFLNEPFESQVLEFYNHPHDTGKEGGRAISSKGFVKSSGHYKSWPEEIINECSLLAKDTLMVLNNRYSHRQRK